jgi:hypothetical protein
MILILIQINISTISNKSDNEEENKYPIQVEEDIQRIQNEQSEEY